MTLFAVLVVAVAASCINVGKALQKEGTKRLPRFALDRKVVATYFKDTTWAAGMGMDVCGGLLMVVAISIAPVSLVQPVAAGASPCWRCFRISASTRSWKTKPGRGSPPPCVAR